MGIFILLIIICAFTAAALRQELVLTLIGAAFLLPWMYCLCMTLFLALLHNRRFRRIFFRISPREITTGKNVQVMCCEGDTAAAAGRIIQLPLILVRCRLFLATKDGRQIKYDFNSAVETTHFLNVEKRGAYFTVYDELSVFDILGFFRFAFRMFPEDGARLLAGPNPADEALVVNARSGDSSINPEFSFQRASNLIDHRPYVPGDDPRRINWKLFGHSNDLFVRDDEREKPPRSNITILINTEYDPLLYNARSARRGIDVLCENALAAAIACKESGMDVIIGSGERESPAPYSLNTALAWPAATPLSTSGQLPAAAEDRGVLILSLPRASAEQTALDRFLKNAAGRSSAIDLLFMYDAADAASLTERHTAAETCAALYNRRSGIRARAAGV